MHLQGLILNKTRYANAGEILAQKSLPLYAHTKHLIESRRSGEGSAAKKNLLKSKTIIRVEMFSQAWLPP